MIDEKDFVIGLPPRNGSVQSPQVNMSVAPDTDPARNPPDRASNGQFTSDAKKVDDAAQAAKDNLAAKLKEHAGVDEDEQPKAEAKGKEEQAESTEPEAKAKESSEEKKPSKALQGALEQIRTSGLWDEDDIEGLSEKQVIAFGERARKINAKALNGLQQANKQKPEVAAAEPVAKAAEPSEDPIKVAAQRFGEKYEGEFGQELEEYGRAILKTTEVQRGKDAQRIALLENTVQEMAFESTRASLRERFPQIDEPEGEAKLLEKMNEKAQIAHKAGTPYESMKRLVKESVHDLWAEQAIEAAEERAEAAAQRKAKNASNAIPRGRDVKARESKPNDVDAAALAAAQGLGQEEVRRAFNAKRR